MPSLILSAGVIKRHLKAIHSEMPGFVGFLPMLPTLKFYIQMEWPQHPVNSIIYFDVGYVYPESIVCPNGYVSGFLYISNVTGGNEKHLLIKMKSLTEVGVLFLKQCFCWVINSIVNTLWNTFAGKWNSRGIKNPVVRQLFLPIGSLHIYCQFLVAIKH